VIKKAVLGIIRHGLFTFMNLSIQKASRADIVSVIGLLHEFADYEKLREHCEITEDRLSDAVFGDDAFVECIIALDRDTPIAYAIFYPNFSSFRGQKGMYLEDIFITAGYRGKGVGDAMLKEIARLARLKGFERIDFQVLEWNTPAIKFYEKCGAVRDDDERHFKFVGEAFESLAD
jgi:GNAT superfamily N-acetyltransferase